MKRLALAAILALSSITQAQTKPKVRAITAFVRLDSKNYQHQLADALTVLHKTEAEFKSQGYEVETIRFTTQPLADLTSGLSEDRALAFLGKLDELAVNEKVDANIGPAMLHDTDNPATMHLLERALSTLPHLNASAIIADDAGIHWKTISRTTELVKYVAAHSPHAQGTFNFAATALLKPYGPFFPGSWHHGSGGQFSIGFEGANIVREVFTKDKGNVDAATADLIAALTIHAKVADAVGNKIAAATHWTYMGVDPTPRLSATFPLVPPSKPSPAPASARAARSPPPASSPLPSKPFPSNKSATPASWSPSWKTNFSPSAGPSLPTTSTASSPTPRSAAPASTPSHFPATSPPTR
jgi:uncharacterized protein (UPF0210 family)